MTCNKCEPLIKDLISLAEKYRYSYITNAYKEVLQTIQEGNLDWIKARDKKVISGLKNPTDARAEMRHLKVKK